MRLNLCWKPCAGSPVRREFISPFCTAADDGQSGVSFDRPEFRRMEQAIHDGKIDCIVCRDLSRFSRNYIEAGRYLEKIFLQLNIRFIAINDSYDNVNGNIQSDSFIVPFKNLINGTYCKDISVKIRSSLDVKRRKGEYVGSLYAIRLSQR